jgi:hypothetical protein
MALLDGWEVGAITRALRETKAKMPIEVAAHIANEVLLGLSYAHTLKVQGYQPHIVHRDVSPSNIMCLRAGGVKLLDFGVASATGGEIGDGDAKISFCGKVSYSAPEYLLGRGQDARIDLFSVGVVLWEMLIGERLFRGASDAHSRAALLSAPIAPPSARRPAIPAEIDRIVMKALERDPERRYQSAAAMAEDLDQFLGEQRYQRKTLPRLLSHLFGEDPSQQAIVVTAVEELLQSTATIPPATIYAQARPSSRGGSVRETVRRLLRTGALTWLALVGVTVSISLMFLHAAHRAGGTVAAIATPQRAVPVLPEIHPIVTTPAPTAAPRTTRAAAPRVAPAHALSAPQRRWTLLSSPSRRAPIHRARAIAPEAGSITSGRSIDPFAEAASRGPRP